MSEERDYEAEAIKDGWNPNFDGPGKKDAKTFVEDGEKISGMLKSKIDRLEERIGSLTDTNAEFKKYTDKQREKDHKENERLIAELEAAKAQAITDGDGVAAVKAEREINQLQVDPRPAADEAAYNRMATQWATDNEWYATNKKLSGFANGIADDILREGYQGQAYFNELTRRVKDTFPEEFKNPNREKASSVETDGSSKGGSKAKTWANLPADAKAAAIRFENDIPGYKREDYVAAYEWELEA